MQDVIRELCYEYTDLSDEEVKIIQMMAMTLQPLANLEAADIFIDCPYINGDAIVVAEAKPEEAPSSYKNSVVGMLAKAENEPAVARTFKLGVATKYMKARTQEDNYTIQSVEPIKYNSRVIGVLIRERRITDEEDQESMRDYYEAVEIPLKHMINENEWLTESIDEGLLLVDTKGYVIFRNLYVKRLFSHLGYVEDILGQKYKNICPAKYNENGDPDDLLQEVRMGSHYLRVRQIQMEQEGIRMAVIIRDVTWDREQEKNLVLKSAAIKEVHHRVKNSLQTVASLLRLQARRTDNPETKEMLYESINRILSISATHQLLSQSGMDDVSLRAVLETMKNNAQQLAIRPNLQIQIELSGDDITVNADVASAVALVVNELVVNSLKYAFKGREEGYIEINVKKGTLYSNIAVTDNGIGFDPELKSEGSLGLNLVQTMVRDKLHGNLKISVTSEGTKVYFDFINQNTDMLSITI